MKPESEWENEPTLTLQEAAAILRVSTKTLVRLVSAGDVLAIKVGRQWRFTHSTLNFWAMGQIRARNKAPLGVANR